jgi:hypothetical protein
LLLVKCGCLILRVHLRRVGSVPTPQPQFPSTAPCP